ncbi:MAG: hypothetical protein IT324_00115 [Anaerolineae bacterium]|nr:hypothetical protein [Anaerolineae bacterium]
MPYQNRVTPFSEIVAYPERGKWMGNRGCLHDDHQQLTKRRWTTLAWIICETEFKGRRRPIMASGKYTELFFLDEATALAAGHRPCGECRRDDYQRFKAFWLQANGSRLGDATPTIANIDKIIHQERVDRDGKQRTHTGSIDLLPNGTFITLDDPHTAYLVWDDTLREWSPAGYKPPIHRPKDRIVAVLTPESYVATLSAGYVPQVDFLRTNEQGA